MKKTAVILCAVLGTLGGLLITLIGAIAFGFVDIGLFPMSDKPKVFPMLLGAAVMIAVCIPIQFLRENLRRKFCIPAPLFIASVCAVPLILSTCERAQHLYLSAHGGYSGFMGGLGYGITDLFSLSWLVASIAFCAGQVIMAIIFTNRRKKLAGSK